MPRTGRPPKPVELKERLGNPGKRKLPQGMEVIEAVPSAAELPHFDSGRELLQYVMENGANWIIPTDAVAVLLVTLYDDMLEARARWRDTREKDDFRAYDALIGRVATCLAQLGLNPADRGRLGLARAQAQKTGLEAAREARELMLRDGHRDG